MKFVYNPKGAKLSAATEGDQIPTEAWYKKLQTFIHQIEFHNDAMSGYGNVEQVRLKVFPEDPVRIGSAIWLWQAKLSCGWNVFIQ